MFHMLALMPPVGYYWNSGVYVVHVSIRHSKSKVPAVFATVRASFCRTRLSYPKQPHKSVRWHTETQKGCPSSFLLCDQLAQLGASAAVTNVTGTPFIFWTCWASGNIRRAAYGYASGRRDGGVR
jgi:hypothetical protein